MFLLKDGKGKRKENFCQVRELVFLLGEKDTFTADSGSTKQGHLRYSSWER